MLHTLYYSIGAIQDEAKHLVESGKLSRSQPIHNLCSFFRDREWCQIERELEQHQYLLRDRLCDLISHECWQND
jgi:hypothetical protein